MEEANRVTAYLKVTAEFYDPDATPETVRACVEQDLEDAGYEVEVLQEHADDGRDYKAEFTSFVDLVTFHYFKRHRFIGTPSYSAAKAAFIGCLPEWRKEQIESAAIVTYEAPTVIFKGKEKWISVKDRIPHNHDCVLVYSSETGVEIARYGTSGRWVGIDGYVENVTHWMPFPEKPEDT